MIDRHQDAPGYWMNETSGVLRPAVMAYLQGDPLTTAHVSALRAYFRQWIAAPAWRGPMINVLRTGVDELRTRQSIECWLDRAVEAGIDPL